MIGVAGRSIRTAIEQMVDRAEAIVVLITPYFKPWEGLVKALARARLRGVQVRLLIREDDDDSAIRAGPLGKAGVIVQKLERLHAKIYITEKQAMVTSANLYAPMERESWDVALCFDKNLDPINYEEIEKLVLATYTEVHRIERERMRPDDVEMKILILSMQGKHEEIRAMAEQGIHAAMAHHGFCVRCRSSCRHDIEDPLCENCHATMLATGEEIARTRACHACGKRHEGPIAKPYCWPCYRDFYRTHATRHEYDE